MSIVRNMVSDSLGLSRLVSSGDVHANNEVVPTANTSTALTVTGSMLLSPLFLANPGGAATYTLDSAANILAAIANYFAYNQNAQATAGTLVYSGISPGTSWRTRFVNASANAITFAVTANTGVTIARATVAASVGRDMLVTVTSGRQAQTLLGTTVNASAVISGFTEAQVSLLAPGMVVTNAVAGLQGLTILSVNLASKTVTMSGNASSTNAAGVSITFSPTVTVEGL